jgi:hypothetical protein
LGRKTTADSSAALRNDNRKNGQRQGQLQRQNAGILRCAQNDNRLGEVKKNKQLQLQTQIPCGNDNKKTTATEAN